MENIEKFLDIDLCKDINFKFVFGKNDPLNREVLRKLIEVYLHRKVENLIVMSEELKVTGNYNLQQVFDIFAKFNESNKVDIEMQFVDNENEIGARMSYYLSNVGSSQVKKGDSYSSMGEFYILLFMNYKRYKDDQLVHDFSMYTKDGTPFDNKSKYMNIITVEIPKVEYKSKMMEEEIWAYMLKCSGSKEDEVKPNLMELVSSRKEISMLVEATSGVSRNEKEWLEEFNKKRVEIAEATRRERIMKEEREAGRVEGRAEAKAEDVLAFCDILSPEEIASRLKMDLEKVNEIINSK